MGTGGANVYGFDGDGKRVKKTEGGTTVYYVSSTVLGQTVMEVSSSSVQRAYVYNGSKLVAMQATDGQFYWLHTNHLGNSRAMTDASGNLTYKGQFDPYGAALTEWSSSGNTNLNNKKFTGYERDSTTGLDYAQARMYNSERGRFMQTDPIRFRDGSCLNKKAYTVLAGVDSDNPQSFNLYNYVSNDPVNDIDPTGMQPSVQCYNNCKKSIPGMCEQIANAAFNACIAASWAGAIAATVAICTVTATVIGGFICGAIVGAIASGGCAAVIPSARSACVADKEFQCRNTCQYWGS